MPLFFFRAGLPVFESVIRFCFAPGSLPRADRGYDDDDDAAAAAALAPAAAAAAC